MRKDEKRESMSKGTTARRAWLVGMAAVVSLMAACWWGMAWSPVHAQETGAVSIRKSFSTTSEDGQVYNGDTIVFSVVVNNGTNDTLTDLLILDVLPENVLEDVQCLDPVGAIPCDLITETRAVREPLGGTLLITTTRQIGWEIPRLGPGASAQRSFTARVIGQADGATFINVAFLSYVQGGLAKNQTSNEVPLTVLLRIEQGGETLLSDTPTWFSQDVGGTLSMDWADFNGDGLLDLALGSTIGASVYRNNGGQLELFWSNNRPAYGVRWADVDGDRVPELIVVGDVERLANDALPPNTAQAEGVNYVFRYDPTTGATNRRFTQSAVFNTPKQVVRVEAADISGDGFVDIIVSTNAINPECPVWLFTNDGTGQFDGAETCISRAATAAIKPADFDNDGDIDLVLGLFPNRVQLLVNNNGTLDPANARSIEEGVMFLPYDFAWGDFDGDGLLDLAAAYPLMREVRIYRNLGNDFAAPISLSTNVFLTPYAIDWGDFSGDGKLDLAVADSPPIIYEYVGGEGSSAFRPFAVLGEDVVTGQVWSLRAVDQNNDGDMDLALTDRDGPSLVVSNFRPPLNVTLDPIPGVAPFQTSQPSSSVTWADMDGDGYLDLIFGAGPAGASTGAAALNTKIYYNDGGEFFPETVRTYSGFGPHTVAVGDTTGNGALDVAIGTTSETRLHMAGDFLAPAWTFSGAGEKTLVWGDVDGDTDLDLLVATASPDGGGYIELFLNDGSGSFGTAPVWRIDLEDAPRSLALGDMDNDGFLDIAVGTDGVNQVYRNTRDNAFELYWTAGVRDYTRAVVWGDYNGDGYLDLAVGNYGPPGGSGEPNYIYRNISGGPGRSFALAFTTEESFRTTSLDWGDWDNDGDLDLAVGNYGQKDQIYVNSSAGDRTQFFWLWSSAETLNTTGIAWGDRDNDGDLDLAISQAGTQLNGIYTNNLVVPSHLPGSNFGVAALVNPPLYVHTGRPGATASAYAYSSAELLSGPDQPEVLISFQLHNPQFESMAASALMTETIKSVVYEYSVNGGGQWHPATVLTTTLEPVSDSQGRWLRGSAVWDAVRDQAIGDNARFRVRVLQSTPSGPVQRVAAGVISPPFRVRAITCVWPENPQVLPGPTVEVDDTRAADFAVAANESVRFTGKVSAGTGSIYYTWDFGDGSAPKTGQVAQHTFARNGLYTVRMAVRGEPCPQTRERVKTVTVQVGSGVADLMLPIIQVPPAAGEAAAAGGDMPAASAVAASAVDEAQAEPVAPQVTGLKSAAQADSDTVWLRWDPSPVPVDGYRLYRGEREATVLEPWIDLPPDVTAYPIESPGCDLAYYMTSYITSTVGEIESLPSDGTYYTPSCAADAE